MRRLPCAAVVLSACVAGAVALRGQTFSSGVETVEVTATVVDAAGRLVSGLSQDAFELFEDGDPQPITHFSNQRVPVSLGVLVDASDSMRGQPIEDARRALGRFMTALLDADDEAFIGTFNHAPKPLSAWTQPPSALGEALSTERPSGGTAIYDAVVASIDAFARRHRGRAALVVISDGADTASDVSLRQAQEKLRRTDAFVYAIAIDAEAAQRRATRVEPDALRQLTGPTGGYTEVVSSAGDLPAATERIAQELNSQYTFGYQASRPPDGKWRSIRVRAKTPGLVTRARRGYYATPKDTR